MKKAVKMLACKENLQQMCHLRMVGEPLPSEKLIAELIGLCRSLLFPGFFGGADVNGYNIEYTIGIQCERLKWLLENQILAGSLVGKTNVSTEDEKSIKEEAKHIAIDFIQRLPELRRVLHTDVEAIYKGDPAASSTAEVIYCYPCIKAIINYRIAHELLLAGVPVIPRMITESAHSETGIDIHPGATIGEYFAIDHGTGVVIGETAIIGRNVKLYQGVTLGARSFPTDENDNLIKGIPRHPIIGDNVVIYSNATILGRVTIGSGAVVGGNIWVTTDVAPGEKLVQAKSKQHTKIDKDE
ncbi:MAG: serine acetyltransferase [Muribaculaceae bacterium]|nr:serine acetyltransferase [Muribaculaceae bacterium]